MPRKSRQPLWAEGYTWQANTTWHPASRTDWEKLSCGSQSLGCGLLCAVSATHCDDGTGWTLRSSIHCACSHAPIAAMAYRPWGLHIRLEPLQSNYVKGSMTINIHPIQKQYRSIMPRF
jgi:hypothetical protein